jgi:hypothetical protein
VSWKHFAIHRELLVREGEAVPPTKGRVPVTVDGYLPSGTDPAEAGDALMETLCVLVRQAGAVGLSLTCRFPGRADPVAIDGEALAGLRRDPSTVPGGGVPGGGVPGGGAPGGVGVAAPSASADATVDRTVARAMRPDAAATVAGFLPGAPDDELGSAAGSGIVLTARKEASLNAPGMTVVSVYDRLVGGNRPVRRRSLFLREGL